MRRQRHGTWQSNVIIVGVAGSRRAENTAFRRWTKGPYSTLARADLRAAAKRLGRPARPVRCRRRVQARSRWCCRSALDLLANIRELVDVHGVRFVVTTQGLDLKPGGDAISRLLMTVLAAVAEFEQYLSRQHCGMPRVGRFVRRTNHTPGGHSRLSAVFGEAHDIRHGVNRGEERGRAGRP